LADFSVLLLLHVADRSSLITAMPPTVFLNFDHLSHDSANATDNQFAVFVAGKDLRAEN
jgi:hypothetical protein